MSRWAVATASPLKNKGPHSPLRDRATHARQAYSRSKNWYDGMPDVPDVNIAKRMYERNTNSAPNPLQPSITSPQRDYTPHISTPHTKQLMPPSSTATFDELQRVEELLSPNTRNSRLTRHQSPQQASFSPPPLLSHPIQDSDVIPYNIQQQQQQQSQSHIGPFRYTAQTVPHQVQYIRRMNSPPRTSPPSDPRKPLILPQYNSPIRSANQTSYMSLQQQSIQQGRRSPGKRSILNTNTFNTNKRDSLSPSISIQTSSFSPSKQIIYSQSTFNPLSSQQQQQNQRNQLNLSQTNMSNVTNGALQSKLTWAGSHRGPFSNYNGISTTQMNDKEITPSQYLNTTNALSQSQSQSSNYNKSNSISGMNTRVSYLQIPEQHYSPLPSRFIHPQSAQIESTDNTPFLIHPASSQSFTTANIIMQHSNSPTTKNSYSPPGFGEQQLQNMAQEAKQIQAKAEWDNQQWIQRE